jgi:hypothetical protein
LIDEELSRYCSFKFLGLDAETAEKESVRLQQDMAVHMTTDEVLEKVEKKPIGKRFGGQFLLNPQWQAVVDKYFMVGDVMEHFFGMDGASQDPRFQYIRDPFWFNNVQIVMQQQQMEQQAQAQQQQVQAEQQQAQQQKDSETPDLTRSIDQLSGLLNKGEHHLSSSKRHLLSHQKRIIQDVLAEMEEEAKLATEAIVEITETRLKDKQK